MLAWGLPSGVCGACDNTLIPEWRCPVKRTSQDTGEYGPNGLNVHTSICDLHPCGILPLIIENSPVGRKNHLKLPLPPPFAQSRLTPSETLTAIDQLLDSSTDAEVAVGP